MFEQDGFSRTNSTRFRLKHLILVELFPGFPRNQLWDKDLSPGSLFWSDPRDCHWGGEPCEFLGVSITGELWMIAQNTPQSHPIQGGQGRLGIFPPIQMSAAEGCTCPSGWSPQMESCRKMLWHTLWWPVPRGDRQSTGSVCCYQ